ncbi:unnamed protein product [Amoebophrya sp. A25]|nr:unnamed protein product [Amoebophrya sp. A25]|eukprot:GSA25T00017345001.1
MAQHWQSDDYYEVLQVQRGCSESDIKKAYRKLALKYHPDKNPDDPAAEEAFKRVSEAYETLGNAEKRQMYDRFGKDGPRMQSSGGGMPGGGQGGFHYGQGHDPFGGFGGGAGPTSSPFGRADAFSVFRDFFGDEDPFANFFNNSGAFQGFHGGGAGRGSQQGRAFFQQQGFGGMGQQMDPFGGSFFGGNDSFFGGGGGGSFSSQSFSSNGFGGGTVFSSMSSSSGGGFGGTSSSTSSSTRTVNGVTVRTTRKSIRHGDGRVEESVTEEQQGPDGRWQTVSSRNSASGGGQIGNGGGMPGMLQ